MFRMLSQTKVERVLNLVEMKGYFLKRSYGVKLDIAREIMEDVKVKNFTGEEFLDYLETLRPVKAHSKKEVLPTFIGQVKASEADRPILSGQKFIITSAQNETAVFSPFFNNLKAYADHLQAKLIVLPVHYNTSAFSGQAKGNHDWYASEVKDHLIDSDHWLAFCNGINLSASTNVLPTAVMPVNACAQMVGSGVAAIIGHTKQQAKTLPRMKGQYAKWAYTTGTCTVRNYVQSAAGAKAEADHAYGALIVEICEESLEWNVRQLRGSEIDGHFYDLMLKVDNGNVIFDSEPLSLVMGDVHGEKLDHAFYNKTLDFIEENNIQKIVLHDLHDFSSRNHHNRESGHFLASMLGRTVEEDLRTTSRILTDLRNVIDGGDIIVVQSNHDDALKRWLDCNKYNPSKDPINAVTYHKLNAAVYRDIINKEPERPILETALAELQLDSGMAVFLNLDQSCLVHGVEVGYHGHTGTNGSRGSPTQFAKIGIPMVTGHTHSPSMIGNVTTVGCMNLDQDYNVGMSSWDLCHAVIYPNGYTSLIRL